MIEINSIYTLLLNEIKKNTSNVFLIKTSKDNTLKDFFTNDKSLSLGNICLYKSIDNTENTEPYAPFLSLISEQFDDISELNNILNNLRIYPAHKELLKSYFTNGTINRNEPILPFDFTYEKSKFYSALVEILNYMSNNSTLFILLENINFASFSTVSWIKWLLSNNISTNFKIIASCNNYNYYSTYFQNEFDELIEMLQKNGPILEINKNSNYSEKLIYIPQTKTSSLLSLGDNFFNLFALEEALLFYKKYYEFTTNPNSLVNDTNICDILCKLGDTYCLMGEYDKAFEYYDNLLNISLDRSNEINKIISTQKISMINILRGKYSAAENLAKQSYKLAKKINSEILIFHSYKLIFWINEKSKYRTTLDEFNFEDEFIRIAKKYNQKNMLAYYLTHSFNAIIYASPDDAKIANYNEGHRIALEIDNQNCILSAHLKTALVYAVRGHYNISIKYYEKVEKLLIEMKDYFRLAQTYNGIGYYYLTSGDYEKANFYYEESLKNLRYNWNFDEICMTLVNKGLNSLLANDYTSAENCFKIFISMINILKLERLRLSTLTRIYGIIGLNNYYLGNYYRAYSFLSKMKFDNSIKNNKYRDDDDEFFLGNFLQGLLLKLDGNTADALRYFERANYHLIKIEGSLKCLYPKFIYEYCELLESVGDISSAYKLKKNGLNFCSDNNYIFYTNILLGIEPKSIVFDRNLTHIEWAIEAAKQQTSIDALNSKVDEINFLNLFQENLGVNDDLYKVINNSMVLLENRFVYDFSLLITHSENSCNMMYALNKTHVNNSAINEITLLLRDFTSPIVFPKISSNFNPRLITLLTDLTQTELNSLLYIPIIKDNKLQASFLCTTKIDNDIVNNDISLNSENLRIINIAIKQLHETIQRIQGQQRLLQAANTDILTGLCNRQGFYNRIYEMFEGNLTLGNKINNYYLFYIDLDNFKYYNDTFGHKIGDKVLIWYGDILTSVIKENDLAIRYGGDEFLLLLQNTTEDDAIKIANNIYSFLSHYNGYTYEISSLLQKTIQIPSDKLLSCSMGVVNFVLSNDVNFSEIMEHADTSMYVAKNSGKHKYIFYNKK